MRYLILVSTLLFAASASAGTYSDSLGRCLVESTSPTDKTALVRWIYANAARHPEVASIASVTAADLERMQRRTAALFQRLLTKDCREETQAAARYEGTQFALHSSFGLLGQIAMQELMRHPEVGAGFGAFAQYMDEDKLQELGLDQ